MTTERQAIGAAKFIEVMKGRESLSGPGSTMSATTELRAWFPGMLKRLGVRSIADIPCGDWAWMQSVDLTGIEYVGYDLSAKIIHDNQAQHEGRDFRVWNAITHPPDRADLILCRDFLVHLTLEHAKQVIENFRASGSRYLAVTTFDGIENAELSEWWTGWGWRPLNMEAEPFSLGDVVDGVSELYFPDYANRWTKVYKL